MLIAIDQAKAHLRIDGTDEDGILSIYIGAAELAASEFLNRKLYEDQTALDAAVLDDPTIEYPMVANDLVKAAILLTLGFLYENREEVVAGVSVSALPIGSTHLLQPYRVLMGA